MDKNALRAQAHHLKPCIRIGKAGLSPGILQEVDLQLKQNKLIKIKLLAAFADLYEIREVIHKLAEQSGSTIIQQTGNTLVLYRERSKRGK